jgi:hypothetical protein
VNAEDFLVAKHEAAHCVTAHLLFWEVSSVERNRNGHGITHIEPRTDGDIKERGIEYGMILLGAILIQPAGAAEDLRKLSEVGASGIALATVWRRTKALLGTDQFLDLYSAVTDALWRSPLLTAADLQPIFGAASTSLPPSASPRDVRSTAAVVPPGSS